MKKICCIVTALIMALTIFVIPNLGFAYADNEDGTQQDVVVALAEKPDKPTVSTTSGDKSVIFNVSVGDNVDVAFSDNKTASIDQWEVLVDNSYTKDKLNDGQSVTLYFCSYVEVPEDTAEAIEFNGSYVLLSDIVEATGTAKEGAVIPTAPSAVTFKNATPGYTNIVFSWNAVDADGYAYSRWAETLDDNTFRDNGTSTSFDFTGLEQRKNKAFWVIAYRVVPEGISEADAKAAGAVKLNPSGKLVIPSKVASTSAKTLTIERCERTKYDKGYVYKYYDQNGVFRGTSYSMWNTIKNKKSKTKYLIALDTRRNNIIIYKGKKGNWKPYKQFVCACGVDGHRTPRGDFKVQRRKPKFQTGDKVGAVVVRPKYTCWYATKFKGAVFFHSTLYYLNSKSRHAARHVGKHYSHGCVRLEIKNAKWIKDTIPFGTRVLIV